MFFPWDFNFPSGPPRPLTLSPYSRGLDLAGPCGTGMSGRTSSKSHLAISSFSPPQESAGRPHRHEAQSELSAHGPILFTSILFPQPPPPPPSRPNVPFLTPSCSVSQRLPAQIPTSTRSHPSTSREVRVPLASWAPLLALTGGVVLGHAPRPG